MNRKCASVPAPFGGRKTKTFITAFAELDRKWEIYVDSFKMGIYKHLRVVWTIETPCWNKLVCTLHHGNQLGGCVVVVTKGDACVFGDGPQHIALLLLGELAAGAVSWHFTVDGLWWAG